MRDRIVRADRAVGIVDDAGRRAELQEHAADFFFRLRVGALREQLHVVVWLPFDDAHECRALGVAAVEDVARNFRNPIHGSIAVHIGVSAGWIDQRAGCRVARVRVASQPPGGAGVVTVETTLFVGRESSTPNVSLRNVRLPISAIFGSHSSEWLL